MGYSHYYGDEIKTLYLRKDVSALNFLMDQRKGPGQFITSWVAEKVSGGYNEFWIRFPYALAGIFLVLAVYYFARQNFDFLTALIAAVLFSLNGFYIAFSRIAQYQVLYLLFGFLSLILAKRYNQNGRLRTLILSGIFLSLSLLCHYDAVFFFIPLFFLVGKKQVLMVLGIGIIISLIFYIPNIFLGYFNTNSFSYISKRLTGYDYLKNNSLYTISVYNPLYLYIVVFAASFVVGINKACMGRKSMLVYWTAVPFLAFQFLFLNPGTHIHNYILPATFVSSIGLKSVIEKRYKYRNVVAAALILIFFMIYGIQLWTYVPVFNRGYPWRIMRPNSRFHLYLYGFPYQRGWDRIGKDFKSLTGFRNFYTNDNENVAKYYLYGVPSIAPGSNFLPQYYFEVKDPQELQQKGTVDKANYQQIETDAEPNIKVYRRINN